MVANQVHSERGSRGKGAEHPKKTVVGDFALLSEFEGYLFAHAFFKDCS